MRARLGTGCLPIRDEICGVPGNGGERKPERQRTILLDDRGRRPGRLECHDARAAVRGVGAMDGAGTCAADSGRRVDDRLVAGQQEFDEIVGILGEVLSEAAAIMR